MGRSVCRGLRPVSHEEMILVAEGSSWPRRLPGPTLHFGLYFARREVESGSIQSIGWSCWAQGWMTVCNNKIVMYVIVKTKRRRSDPVLWQKPLHQQKCQKGWVELNWLFYVTINDISVIYVTAHRCAGGLKKKLDLRSGSQRHRHFVGFFNVPGLAPTRDHPFYTVIPTHRPIYSPFTITLGIRKTHSRLNPQGPHRGNVKRASGNTNNATKKFDKTAIADRLRTVSWSN